MENCAKCMRGRFRAICNTLDSFKRYTLIRNHKLSNISFAESNTVEIMRDLCVL